MVLFKELTIIATIFTFANSASFLNFGDICKPSKNQLCPNHQNEIILLQKLLNVDKNKKVSITGVYDDATQKAVIDFQKSRGLPATGYVGILTKSELDNYLKFKLSLLHKDKKYMASKKKVKKSLKNDISQLSDYEAFKKRVNLRKSYAIFKNRKLLRLAGKRKTLLKVDISEQRVKLLVDGKVALSAPCTTGSKHKLEPNTRTYRDKRTPLGTFKILEKIANKRSTIFGNIYRHGKLVYHGDRRKYRGSWKGAKFVGAPLFHWMRLTKSGIGLHASNHVKRYPGSNGCIRLPKNVAKMLFSKLKKGTIVKVVN